MHISPEQRAALQAAWSNFEPMFAQVILRTAESPVVYEEATLTDLTKAAKQISTISANSKQRSETQELYQALHQVLADIAQTNPDLELTAFFATLAGDET